MIPTIVLIDDNKTLVQFLEDLLKTSTEANVVSFTSGVEALQYLKANKPHLVLVDLGLEDINGKTICEETRKIYADVPIIVLTGDKNPETIVMCLNVGADDYITKPFNSDELIARVNAKIRTLNKDSASSNTIQLKDLTLDTQTFEVFKGDKRIDLTPKEFQLLHYLMINKFRVCSREKILFSVWGYTTDVDTRVVDVHVGKLRKKIETKKDKYISSIRGHGYRIIEDSV